MPSYRVLTGPTASGKTDWLLQRAKRVPLRVISADSRQVYRFMDIGTGKPELRELDYAPHYGLNLIEPDESFSAHDFILMAARALGELEDFLAEQEGEVWVCGGTGLYIRALVEGLPLGPPPRPKLRAALWPLIRERGSAQVASDLWLQLREPDNPVRVFRKAEAAAGTDPATVYSYAGLDPTVAGADLQHLPAEYQAALAVTTRWRCAVIHVLDPGNELESRIKQRVASMFERRLVDEVRELRDLGFGETGVVVNGIAYKEAGLLLDGLLDKDEALHRAIIRTRQYAKRQRTYFRGQGWEFRMQDELDRVVSTS